MIVLAVTLASTGARAESPTADEQRQAEGWLYVAQWISVLSAKGYVWSHACRHGDPEVWKRALAAADRYYQRCVPARSAVARIVESKLGPDARVGTNTSRRAITTMVFERDLARASDAFNAADRDKVCADPKMRQWLDSGHVDPRENWEWFDRTLPFKLGTDPSLADQLPCGELAAQEDPK
jgi:hypothetical protein